MIYQVIKVLIIDIRFSNLEYFGHIVKSGAGSGEVKASKSGKVKP